VTEKSLVNFGILVYKWLEYDCTITTDFTETFLTYPPWRRMCPFNAGKLRNRRSQTLHCTGSGSLYTQPGQTI